MRATDPPNPYSGPRDAAAPSNARRASGVPRLDPGRGGGRRLRVPAGGGRERLWTASLAVPTDAGSLYLYAACAAHSADEFREWIRARIGPHVEQFALVRAGVDPGDPVFAALVSEHLREILGCAAIDPTGPLALRCDIWIEHRAG